ncbi:MAG: APC family permease, partial [Gaiellaceae bacterium]
VLGVRVSLTFGYLAGILLLIPLFCFIVLLYLTGDWESSNLTYKLDDPGLAWGGWQMALVWLWIMCWSTWGVDVCATFAPEYKDTVNDTKLALRSAAVFSLLVYIFLPMGMVGAGGEEAVAAFDYVGVLETIVGGASDFFVVVICLSFLVSMNTATADGGRALYGIARDDMTIRQLYSLNRFGVPGLAMTLDMIINILFVWFVGNIFGILAASNLGYVLAHFFALTAFILLRKDRPGWPRPIRLANYWVPIAAVLAAICALLTVVGFGWFQIAAGGYGGTKEKIIGVAILAAGILLFLFRRIVQDRERPHWREETPTMPVDVVQTPEGAAAATTH